MILNWEI